MYENYRRLALKVIYMAVYENIHNHQSERALIRFVNNSDYFDLLGIERDWFLRKVLERKRAYEEESNRDITDKEHECTGN